MYIAVLLLVGPPKIPEALPPECKKAMDLLCFWAQEPATPEPSDKPEPPRNLTMSTWRFREYHFPWWGTRQLLQSQFVTWVSQLCWFPACDSWSLICRADCKGNAWPNACCTQVWQLPNPSHGPSRYPLPQVTVVSSLRAWTASASHSCRFALE